MRMILSLLIANSFGKCPTMTVETSAKVQETHLNEISGLSLTPKNDLWVHNDSGDAPIVYRLDKKGSVVQKLDVENVKAKDWEDKSSKRRNFCATNSYFVPKTVTF